MKFLAVIVSFQCGILLSYFGKVQLEPETNPVPTTKESSVTAFESIPRIPEDNDTFRTIREKQKVYVDKSYFLRELFGENEPSFLLLTRPRRFGKSVFLDMVYEFVSGNEQYFKDTNISQRGNGEKEDGTWKRYPVIKLDLSTLSEQDFENELKQCLTNIADSYNLTKKERRLSSLIRDLKSEYKLPVTVLIDEYTHPLIPADGKEIPEETRLFLHSFYAQIKANLNNLRLALLVGVARVSLNTLGSGANNFKDVTFDPEFSTAVGFTAAEIETYFNAHLRAFAQKRNIGNASSAMNMLADWYDGYRFSFHDTSRVYNPITICVCLREKLLGNYWTNTGSSKYITDMTRPSNLSVSDFRYFSINEGDLEFMLEPPLAQVSPKILMLTFGYVTIKEYDKKNNLVFLGLPNKEIKEYLESIIPSGGNSTRQKKPITT